MEKDEKILKIHQVVEIVGISRSSVYNMVQRNDFPKPLKLGSRSSGWLKSEVDAWIESRASLRFTGGAA
ncbi:MAG: helix-turn-helix transcriptional regulator [Leptospirillum sp.]|jgi:prophage regulatory protein